MFFNINTAGTSIAYSMTEMPTSRAVSNVTSSRTASPDGADAHEMVGLRDAQSSSEPVNQATSAASMDTRSTPEDTSHNVAIASPSAGPSGQVYPVRCLTNAAVPVSANVSGPNTSQQSSTSPEESSKLYRRFCTGTTLANILGGVVLTITIYFGWRSRALAKWTASIDYRDSCVTDQVRSFLTRERHRPSLQIASNSTCHSAMDVRMSWHSLLPHLPGDPSAKEQSPRTSSSLRPLCGVSER